PFDVVAFTAAQMSWLPLSSAQRRADGGHEGDRVGGRGSGVVAEMHLAMQVAGYLPSRARTSNLTWQPASSRSITRLRAAWPTQAAVGCAVTPRTRIRRLACSITVRMYSRAPVNVTVSMKSAASNAWAWERRKSVQVVAARSGAGS